MENVVLAGEATDIQPASILPTAGMLPWFQWLTPQTAGQGKCFGNDLMGHGSNNWRKVATWRCRVVDRSGCC